MRAAETFTPALIEALTGAGGLLLAVLTSVAAAVWAVLRLLEDRRSARQEAAALERRRIEQRRIDEEGRRAAHVSALMARFGETDDPDIRVWTTLALSLYPKETARLLAMSLGQFDDDVVAGVKLALLSIGPEALPELVRLNRIAQASRPTEDAGADAPEPAVYDLGRLLERTSLLIAAIVMQTDRDALPELDLEGVDLGGRCFDRGRLDGLRFRKARLDGAAFRQAGLRRAAFRGASLAETVFTRAALYEADFTGSTGRIAAIKARLDGARFDHCDLAGSQFDGASLRDVQAEQSDFDRGSFRGAQLHGARLARCGLRGVDAGKLKARALVAEGAKLAKADVTEASLRDARFERCELMGLAARGLRAQGARFLNCNLGGADFRGAMLAGAAFRGCQFGGADFRGADLAGAELRGDALDSAQIDPETRTALGL